MIPWDWILFVRKQKEIKKDTNTYSGIYKKIYVIPILENKLFLNWEFAIAKFCYFYWIGIGAI
jgi:hypothetical protein